MKLNNIELASDLLDSLKKQLENKIKFQKSKVPKDDYNQGWKDGSLHQIESILDAINTYFYEE
jgi:hypothetical protein